MRLTKMFKVGKMGHSILGFSAGHSIKYGLSKVQAMACEIPVSNQTGMGKAPVTRISMMPWHATEIMLTSELPEDHLLSSFSGDGLEQESGGRSRIQVRQETVDTGFTESGQDGAELDELLNSLEVVSVLALLGASALQDVGQQGRVTDCKEEISLIVHSLSQLCSPSWFAMNSIKCCCSASMP